MREMARNKLGCWGESNDNGWRKFLKCWKQDNECGVEVSKGRERNGNSVASFMCYLWSDETLPWAMKFLLISDEIGRQLGLLDLEIEK